MVVAAQNRPVRGLTLSMFIKARPSESEVMTDLDAVYSAGGFRDLLRDFQIFQSRGPFITTMTRPVMFDTIEDAIDAFSTTPY